MTINNQLKKKWVYVWIYPLVGLLSNKIVIYYYSKIIKIRIGVFIHIIMRFTCGFCNYYFFYYCYFFNWLFIVALTARPYRDCHWFSVFGNGTLLIFFNISSPLNGYRFLLLSVIFIIIINFNKKSLCPNIHFVKVQNFKYKPHFINAVLILRCKNFTKFSLPLFQRVWGSIPS